MVDRMRLNPLNNKMNTIKKILGAVGAGSHTMLVVDNLSNASVESLKRVAQLRDHALLDHVLAEHPVQTILLFAGLKAIGESVVHALDYYIKNLGGTDTLCQAKAAAELDWSAKRDLATMMRDAWCWQSRNSDGYHE